MGRLSVYGVAGLVFMGWLSVYGGWLSVYEAA